MLVSERVAAAVTWEVWGSAPGPGHAGLLKAMSGVGMLRMLGGTVGGKGVGGLGWVALGVKTGRVWDVTRDGCLGDT